LQSVLQLLSNSPSTQASPQCKLFSEFQLVGTLISKCGTDWGSLLGSQEINRSEVTND